MSVGLPGFGLGGIFFIISALLGPLVEGVRHIRGESRPGAWREVIRSFAIALLMIVTIEATLIGLVSLASLVGVAGAEGGPAFVLPPLGAAAVTAAILAGLLLTSKALQIVLGFTDRRRRSERRQRARSQSSITRRTLAHSPSCPCCSGEA